MAKAQKVSVDRMIARHQVLSRWHRTHEHVQELRDVETALGHYVRMCGRYGYDPSTGILDVSPHGRFMNWSSEHCFVGTCTIVKVGPPAPDDDVSAALYIYCDRWSEWQPAAPQ